MLKIVLLTVAGLIVLVLIVAAIGYMLPVGHVAAREATLQRPPADVFAAISDVQRYPEWRGDVQRVEVLSASPLRWREHGRNGTITYVVEESVPASRLVSRIDDRSLAFGGSWVYELRPVAGGTTLTITERGEVYNPLFRFMSRYVFGQTATIEAYLTALRKRVDA